MSSVSTQLIAVVIQERFGKTPTAVAKVLTKGALPLPLIARELTANVKLGKIRRALATLVHSELVTFRLGDGNRVIYQLERSRVLNLLRIPRVCQILNECYGSLGTSVFLEYVMNGKLTYTKCVSQIAMRGEEEVSKIRDIFHKFIDTHLLKRCFEMIHDAYDCPVFADHSAEPFKIPNIFFEDSILDFIEKPGDAKKTEGTSGEQTRKRKHEDGKAEAPDAKILWCIDWNRVDRMLRDYIVRETIANCNISEFVCKSASDAFIQLCQTRCELYAFSSSPTPVNDIIRATKDFHPSMDKYSIERALKILHEDSKGVIRRTGDSAGGLYTLDYERAVTLACELQVESFIREKLGERALRIFKLLRQKGFLEEEQIEKLVMMSAKETRELTYALVDAGFVSIRHISKTNDFAPARTFYLYHVNMHSVVHNMLNTATKFVHNLIARRIHGAKRHAGLLEQSERLEEILKKIRESDNLSAEEKEEQEQDIRESYISKEDAVFLDKYGNAIRTAGLVEVLQVDAVTMFEQFLMFSKRRLS
ncbi:hypothetical protein L596_014889 [Steinernema carpocapsae]|uniref:DNA-directed RNA polymerase III subunit RPC3 n=1 Tax=Steinernema carpocapsae TaxID=34508 RepID=A0A4U5NDI4_STECR|nr:hypothetical protein L596_014889 [Steinernema carpocapsae]